MATMVKIKSEKEEVSVDLKPTEIQSMLFYFHDVAHKFHLNTKSFAEHKATDYLYKEMVDIKDGISEKLQGYLDETIGDIEIGKIPKYTDTSCKKLAKEIMDFAYKLYEWAEEKRYCDIENMAQELSGVGAKFNYLLTLK